MPKVFDNFKYSSVKFLDDRQRWSSLEELQRNKDHVLMPNGYEVCIQGVWYQLMAENERDYRTYNWIKRSVTDVAWQMVLDKPFSTLNDDQFEILGGEKLSIKRNCVMHVGDYVDSQTGKVRESNVSTKIKNIDDAENLTYYGKNNQGVIGFHLVQESMTSDMTSSDINTFMSELNTPIE